jgi:hypothetical protein
MLFYHQYAFFQFCWARFTTPGAIDSSGLAPLIRVTHIGVAHPLDKDFGGRSDLRRALDRFRLGWADCASTVGVRSKDRKPVLVFLDKDFVFTHTGYSYLREKLGGHLFRRGTRGF